MPDLTLNKIDRFLKTPNKLYTSDIESGRLKLTFTYRLYYLKDKGNLTILALGYKKEDRRIERRPQREKVTKEEGKTSEVRGYPGGRGY